MRKIILILFMVLLIIPFINATEELGIRFTSKINEPIYLKEPCTVYGAPCGISYNCTYSVIDPSQNVIVKNVTATKDGDYYTYTIATSNLTGKYKTDAYCTNGTLSGQNTFYFEVTPTGDDRGVSWLLLLYIGGAVVLIFALYMGNAYFSIISGFLFGTAGVYSMINGFNNIADVWSQAISYVAIGLGLYLILVSAWELVDSGGESAIDDDD